MVGLTPIAKADFHQRLIEDKKKAINAAYADGFEKGTDIGADLLSILGGSFALVRTFAHARRDSQSKHGLRRQA